MFVRRGKQDKGAVAMKHWMREIRIEREG
jgi:hypothetical protein